MPLSEKMKTAYHEAGHAVQAYHMDGHAVDEVNLEEVAGRWVGNTSIVARYIYKSDWPNIAFAGIIAEARAVAVSNNQFERLEPTKALFRRMWKIVHKSYRREPNAEGWHIRVQTAAVPPPTRVTLSRPDVHQLKERAPKKYRSREMLEGSLVQVCRFFNDPVTWAVVIALATKIEGISPNSIGPFGLKMLVEQALQDYAATHPNPAP